MPVVNRVAVVAPHAMISIIKMVIEYGIQGVKRQCRESGRCMRAAVSCASPVSEGGEGACWYAIRATPVASTDQMWRATRGSCIR